MVDFEEELVQTKAELASTKVCLNAVLICEGNAKTVMCAFVNERVRRFRNVVVQLNRSFLFGFRKVVESAFDRVLQKCHMTIAPGSVVPEARVTSTEAPLEDTGPSRIDRK